MLPRLVLIVLFMCIVLRKAQRGGRGPPTLDRDFMLHFKKRYQKFDYDPNYGYEPYWADGEWVLTTTVRTPDPKDPSSFYTTQTPYICGDECHYLWREIKHVCARYSDTTYYYGCTSIFYNMYCGGKPGAYLEHGFKTYDTYCAFLEAQCRSKFWHSQRMVLVHVGKCEHIEMSFKPLWEGWQPVSRKNAYISSYSLRAGIAVTPRTKKPVYGKK